MRNPSGPRAVLDSALPAPNKLKCATQRADTRLKIAEAVWLNAPRSHQGSDIAEDPAVQMRPGSSLPLDNIGSPYAYALASCS